MRTTTTRWLAAVLTAAGLLVACSGDEAGETSAEPGDTAPTIGTGADPADVAAAPSPGCDADDPVAPGDEEVTITSGGDERWFLRHVPPAHDGTTPVPLVVDFHGYAEGADVHVQMSGLGAFGDDEGFVTLTPQGTGPVPRWDTALGSDDLAFVGDLLDEAERSLCIDTNRVYATGLSNGAFMASAVACQYADRVAAVAPVAGVRDVDGCDPARAVPVVTFHGTEDGFVAFDGGFGEAVADLPAPDGSGRTLGESGGAEDAAAEDPSIPEIVAAWAERNGCDTSPDSEELATDVTIERYSCPAGADVELYRIEGGGHTWPGSDFSARIESIVGRTTTSISADEVMWAFFQSHPMDAGAGVTTATS